MQRKAMGTRVSIAVALAFISGCPLLGQMVDRPDVAFRNVRVRAISFQGITAEVVFAVNNPNSFGIDIDQYTYAFKIGDRSLAQSTSDASIHVPGKGATDLAVPVSFEYADVLDIASRLQNDDRWPFTVEGTVRVATGRLGGATVPFSYRDTLPRPIPPRVTVERVKVNTISFTNARFDLLLGIENRGRYPYTLTAMNGGLALNGQRFAEIDAISDDVRLGPNERQTVTVRTDVSAIEAVRGLQRLLDRGRADYRLTGDARVENDKFGALPFTIDQSGSVALER